MDTGDQTNPKPQGGGDQRKLHDDDYATKNYPPAGDSESVGRLPPSIRNKLHRTPIATSSGGYGSPQNVWSDGAQRGRANVYSGEDGAGLIDQSLSGGDLKDEIQDAKQGAAGTSISKAKADYHPR